MSTYWQRVGQIWQAFLLLGLTSFGGPMAHIAYFRQAFVSKRGWISEQGFAQLLALSQFLPGPASSQLGFLIGYHRAGVFGALLAFAAFTLPSVLLLIAYAKFSTALSPFWQQSLLGGLKILALVIVCDACWGMGRNFCRETKALLLTFVVFVALIIFPTWPWLAISLGAVFGLVFFSGAGEVGYEAKAALKEGGLVRSYAAGSYKRSLLLLAVFIFLLLLSYTLLPDTLLARLALLCYQSGALVFGGGHVVLPLLEVPVVQAGMLTNDDFLAGYGATQLVPGPMFSFAAFLGAKISQTQPIMAALIATLCIFLPGFLLVLAALPLWHKYMAQRHLAGVIHGVNAAVVGLLAALIFTTLIPSAIHGPQDGVFAALVFMLFKALRWPIPVLALVCCSFTALFNFFTGY
ncbi:chromate efflux transporter [Agaribacterium haliotis]|uniref:chromate efflux transporter n=1 Tax=Agaribacterium haliotis TaxID=2013869 RepID=UPI000BB53B8D|nr:chromate efflux transporter [Agaribacterium haliotis]